jgi:succinate dehydrogenase / fumarate reductase, cytochrome b subunit
VTAALGPGLRRRATAWLAPRWRDPGWIAFVLNRLTGLILAGYLVAHFIVLSMLLRGEEGWNGLLEIFGSTPFLVGDTLLIAAVAFHGLNGLRVIAMTFGFGTRHSGRLFIIVFLLAGAITVLAGRAILLA